MWGNPDIDLFHIVYSSLPCSSLLLLNIICSILLYLVRNPILLLFSVLDSTVLQSTDYAVVVVIYNCSK